MWIIDVTILGDNRIKDKDWEFTKYHKVLHKVERL